LRSSEKKTRVHACVEKKTREREEFNEQRDEQTNKQKKKQKADYDEERKKKQMRRQNKVNNDINFVGCFWSLSNDQYTTYKKNYTLGNNEAK